MFAVFSNFKDIPFSTLPHTPLCAKNMIMSMDDVKSNVTSAIEYAVATQNETHNVCHNATRPKKCRNFDIRLLSSLLFHYRMFQCLTQSSNYLIPAAKNLTTLLFALEEDSIRKLVTTDPEWTPELNNK